MRISEPSFTDSGIDATGKTENQTCTRVDGHTCSSTLSLPKSARKVDFGMEPWGGKPTRRVGVLRLPPMESRPPTPTRGGEFEGAKPPHSALAPMAQILQASATRESLPFVVRPPQKAGGD